MEEDGFRKKNSAEGELSREGRGGRDGGGRGGTDLNVVTVSETTKLLLSCGVPNVEANSTEIGVESEGVHFNSERCYRGIVSTFSTSLNAEGSLPMYFFSNSP